MQCSTPPCTCDATAAAAAACRAISCSKLQLPRPSSSIAAPPSPPPAAAAAAAHAAFWSLAALAAAAAAAFAAFLLRRFRCLLAKRRVGHRVPGTCDGSRKCCVSLSAECVVLRAAYAAMPRHTQTDDPRSPDVLEHQRDGCELQAAGNVGFCHDSYTAQAAFGGGVRHATGAGWA